MKQRLGIAQALINAPRLLMLDEPTSALDPLGRKQVLDMIASLAGRTTVFFSTHILADVERVCDRVAILDKGKVVAEADMEDLKARFATHRIELTVVGDASGLARMLEQQPWVTSVETADEGVLSIAVSDLEAARTTVPRALGELGLGLERFESGEVSLEDVFLELVGGDQR